LLTINSILAIAMEIGYYMKITVHLVGVVLHQHTLEFTPIDNSMFPEEGSWEEIWHGLEKTQGQ